MTVTKRRTDLVERVQALERLARRQVVVTGATTESGSAFGLPDGTVYLRIGKFKVGGRDVYGIEATDATGKPTVWSYVYLDDKSVSYSATKVRVGTVATGAAGSAATVTNVGTPTDVVLNFSLPAGAAGGPGAAGQAATVTVGSTTTGAAGTNASVVNVGTSSAAVLQFTVPRGAAGTNGTNGTNGAAATVTVGTVTPLGAGSNPTVTNRGTSSAAILDFGVPVGNAIPTTTLTVSSLPVKVEGTLYLYYGDLYAYRSGAMVRLTWNDISGSAWVNCTIAASMRVKDGDTANTPKARKLGPNRCELYGRLQYGAGTTDIPDIWRMAVLPNGMRPVHELSLPVATEFASTYTTTAKISLMTDGGIYFYCPSGLKAKWCSLDGIIYPLDLG